MNRKSLYIIDGNSYLYRAFFAIPKFTTSQGKFTNATYGFVKMLMKIINQREPDLLVICFDAPGKSFRHDSYENYKATRGRMPDELRPQIDDIKMLVDAFHIPRVEVANVEADDALGTLAQYYCEKDYEVFIVTSDKDMMQMVNEHTHIYDTMKEIVYTPEEVKKKMGVWPHQIKDLLGLMGDSSDNIPGVQGVGPKTAVTLLEKYEHLENIYDHLEDIPGKLRERLETCRDLAFLSKELATVKCDVEVDHELLIPFKPDWELLKSHFRDLEFSSILKEITTEKNHKDILGTAEPQEERDYRGIVTEDAYDTLLKRIKSIGRVSLDTETTSENPMLADLVGISFSFRAFESYYVPVTDHAELPDRLTKKTVLEKLRPLLEDAEIEKYGHNLKYDLLVLARAYMNIDRETRPPSDHQTSLFHE